jgi:hypothetical protein
VRGYVGTFWRFRFNSEREEYLVVEEKDDGSCVVLETSSETFHPAEIVGWEDRLWMHRHYRGEYFDNHTLEPVEPLKRQITALG